MNNEFKGLLLCLLLAALIYGAVFGAFRLNWSALWGDHTVQQQETQVLASPETPAERMVVEQTIWVQMRHRVGFVLLDTETGTRYLLNASGGIVELEQQVRGKTNE